MLRAKHYIILMPSMAKKFYRQSSAVLSGDDFLFWLYDKYFGDGGANQRLPAADFHSIHKALNSMLKDPFLSQATAKTQRLIEERTPGMVSFASNPAEQHQWERFADVSVRDKGSVEADLYRLTMDYVADITSNTLMGEAFPKNNPGLLGGAIKDKGKGIYQVTLYPPKKNPKKGEKTREPVVVPSPSACVRTPIPHTAGRWRTRPVSPR